MKKGDQFSLQIQLIDNTEKIITPDIVEKIQFNIDNLTKVYSTESKDVTYNEKDKCYEIWLVEEETFQFKGRVGIEARIMFKSDTAKKPIGGTAIDYLCWRDCLKKEILND